jgi:glutamate-1-semialdehyde 2,1-aminomutase
MMTAFFNEEPVTDYSTAAASDTQKYAAFFHGMLKRGVYLAPSQFEAAFVSLTHGDEEIDATIAAASEVLREIAS